MLDQPVPNPVAKNPNIHTHKVFASVGLILFGVIVILATLAIIFRGQVGDYLKGVNDFGEEQKDVVKPGKMATSSSSKEEKVEIADWRTFTNSTLGFSHMYPDNWMTRECDGTIFFYAPTNDNLGLCNSGFGGMVVVSYSEESYTDSINMEGYTDVSYLEGGARVETSVGSKAAIKISGKYKEAMEGVEQGATRIIYIVNLNNKTLSLSYYSTVAWGDHTKEFEQIVSSVKFI